MNDCGWHGWVSVAVVACAVQTVVGGVPGANGAVCDALGVSDCCAPRLFIVGAMKCGTNALMAYLASHPALSASWKKSEVNFFSRQNATVAPDSPEGRREYARHLICAAPDSAVWAVDKSPDYLFSADSAVARAAHSVAPSAKVVAVLCDPAVRLWKEWWHNMRIFDPLGCAATAANLTTARSAFNAYVSHQMELYRAGWNPYRNLSIAKGMYAGNLAPWVEAFGEKNVMAVDSTFQLKHRRAETVDNVLRFLGLDPSLMQARAEEEFKDVYFTTHPHLHYSAWKRLHKFYAESNHKLMALIGDGWVKDWEESYSAAYKKFGEESRRLRMACGLASNSFSQATKMQRP